MQKKIFNYSRSALVFTGILSLSFTGSKKKQPNIIMFLIDDMGWTDTSVILDTAATDNNKYLHTPNMEWLASQGMKFTNAYAASPVSSPTRTSLLTGMNPARSRISNWIPGEGNQPAEVNKHLLPEWNIDGLTGSDNTLPKVLKANGYQTAHIGKGHFGNKGTEGAEPLNLGFDINIAGSHTGQPASYYSPFGKDGQYFKVKGLEDLYNDSLYLSDALTIKAVRLIEQMASDKNGRPFFINMAHYAVHTPIQGNLDLIEKYKREDKNTSEQEYATMVESIDISLGAIIKKLRELNIEENTIILFMSDNGALISHSGPPTTNYPLSSGKGSCHEGGTRVPMIVRWPGMVEGNTTCEEPVISDDFFPTILKMANVTQYKKHCKNIDGKDLTPLLTQKRNFKRNDAIYWHYPHYWANTEIRKNDPTIHPYSAIRDGDWKLIYNYDEETVELYNLKKDIGETTNLALQEAEKAKVLCSKLTRYLKKVNAQLPIGRSLNKPVPYPHVK